MAPEEFDKQFLAWLYKDVGQTVANFDEWREALKSLAQLAKDKNYDEVIKDGEEVVANVSATTSMTRTPTNSWPRPIWRRATSRPLPRSSPPTKSIGGRNPDALKQLGFPRRRARRAASSRCHARPHQLYLPDETKTCTAISAICGSRRIITPARSANTPPCSPCIRSTRPPRSSIWPRPISPRARRTRPRKMSCRRSRPLPTIAPLRNYSCSSKDPEKGK